jgi:putative Mg2+ transporter-C (MgtC) family protein
MYSISLIGVLVVLFALTIMNFFEKRFFKERTLRKIEVVIKKKHSNLKALKDIFQTFDVRINSTGFERNVNEATDKITFLVAVTDFLDVQKLADELEKEPGIVTVSVEIIQ